MKTLLLTAWLLPLVVPAATADWPHWRGPAFNGTSPATNLPVHFSPTNNVRWTAEMPGPSAATPIVHGGHVFVSSTDARERKLLALAFDRATGRELWRREIGPGFARDDRSNYASPSPVTDGQRVIFLYGNGEIAAFDFAGEKLWARNLEKDYGAWAMLWTYGASPLLVDGKVIVQVLMRDVPVQGRGRADGPNESYLLALDPANGQEIWRVIRPSEARAESLESFSSPIPSRWQDRHEILVAGGDCLSGHDVRTGKELWRWGTWNPTRIGHWRIVPSPVAAGDVAVIPAPKGAPVYAVKRGGHGELSDSALAWTSTEREVSSDVSTPAYYQGRLYVLNSDRKTLARVDPATGKADWIADLESRPKFESSPTAADGKLYFQNHAGEVFVVAAGPEFKLLHRVLMGDSGDRDTRASIAVTDGTLFIRTAGKLFCIGQ